MSKFAFCPSINFSQKIHSKPSGIPPLSLPSSKLHLRQVDILNKHSAFIHLGGEASLLERKLLNVLFKVAQRTRSNYLCSITLKDIRKSIGWKSNKTYLFECLEKLSKKEFKLNLLNKDKKHKWNDCILFDNFYRKAGILYFQFKPQIMENCLNPNIYAKLDLEKEKLFRHKGSIVLYEVLMDLLSGERDITRVSYRSLLISELKELCGAEKYTYSNFKNRYIVPALTELKEICPELDIGWEAIVNRGKVSAIRFNVRVKPEYLTQKQKEEILVPNEVLANLSGLDENLRASFVSVMKRHKMFEHKGYIDTALIKTLELYFAQKITQPIGFFIKSYRDCLKGNLAT